VLPIAVAQGRAITYSTDAGQDGLQALRQHRYSWILQHQRNQGKMLSTLDFFILHL